MQSVPITTKVVSLNRVQERHTRYMIKFVSDLRQVGGFFLGTPVSSTNKTDLHDIAEIMLKVALSTINHKPIYIIYRQKAESCLNQTSLCS
jgi:hypothetical protein